MKIETKQISRKSSDDLETVESYALTCATYIENCNSSNTKIDEQVQNLVVVSSCMQINTFYN